jgi:hypothetical protein
LVRSARTQGDQSEAPRARSGGGSHSAASRVDRGGALSAQARLLRSLQSTAGNRAVTALVQQWRNDSGATRLPQGRPAVVQRKLRIGGALYGKGDEQQLQQLKQQRILPDWTTQELESDDHYVLNEEATAWVRETDTTLLFYRDKYLPGKEPPGKQGTKGYDAKLSIGSPSPLTTVGLGSDRKTRVGPKHADRRTVSKMSLFSYETTLPGGHWMLQCDVEQGEGGKTGTKKMKIDLTNAGYRIYYAVTQQVPVQNDKVTQGEIHFQLQKAVPVQDVYDAFLAIAEEKRNRTSLYDYNCQDFALAMLQRLGVADQDQQRLVKSAQWRESSRRGQALPW